MRSIIVLMICFFASFPVSAKDKAQTAPKTDIKGESTDKDHKDWVSGRTTSKSGGNGENATSKGGSMRH
jgi:hypothetical protein